MTEAKNLPSPGWRNRLRFFWRRHVQPWWNEYEWQVVGGLAVIAAILGYIGFKKFFISRGEVRPPLDFLYLALQLFMVKSGDVTGPKVWELELARFLAAGVTGYTAVKALAVIFYHQLNRMPLWFMKDHVIICGLGRKGLLLAKEFHERGDQVIVIEQDKNNNLLQHCRDQGTIVLIGNATERELLRKARVHKAKYLFSVCGDDGANAEIAVHTCESVKDRKGKVLTCFAHLLDPDLCNLLREREILTERIPSFRLEFFNVYDSGARALLKEYLDFEGTWKIQSPRPHLLIIGLGRMGRSLVVHAARSWWERYKNTGEKLRITIVDKEAESKRESLCLRYPQLANVCELITHRMDIHSPEFKKGEFLLDSRGHCDPTAIHVCFENDSMGLAAGLALYQQVRCQNVPIIVRMTYDAGLASLLRGFANLQAFGLLDRSCKPDLLLAGTHEILAQVIHEGYVHDQKMLGQKPETNSSMGSWEKLSEGLKESNRRQADHIGLKLKAIGCGIAPLTDWDAKSFQFRPEEIERMAWMEHFRWTEDHQEQRWTYAPGKKDEVIKTHPHLVPWHQLPEEIKDYDRNAVRNIPASLARVDLQIFRLTGKPFGLSLKVLIRDKKGRCLLLKRSKDSKTHPGKWDFPGGKADAGENIDEALVREVAEETGLTISLQMLAGTAECEIVGFQVVHLILEGRWESGQVKLSNEHDDYVWVKPGKIPNMELVDHFKPFAQEYGKKIFKRGFGDGLDL